MLATSTLVPAQALADALAALKDAHAVATDKWRRIRVGLWGLAALSTGLGGVFALGLTS